jgi:molybdopterin-guanine dinucleotide biosynthesis protein A
VGSYAPHAAKLVQGRSGLGGMAFSAASIGAERLSDRVGGLILAGGQNSRMGGTDKAFLIVNGQTVFERTLLLLRRCFPQVVVVSNRPEKYAGFNVEVTRDEFQGRGPLAGIHAGLGLIRFPYAFVVACDMPFLRVEPITFLLDCLPHEAVIPCWDGDIEPLHAVYATALRERMAEALRCGVRGIREFLPRIRAQYVAEQIMRGVHGAEESFRNVNTPDDAARFDVSVGRRP